MSDVLTLPGRHARVRRDQPGRRKGARAAAWLGWALPGVLLAVWQFGASTGLLSSSILPNPIDVGRAAFRLTSSGELPQGMAISTLRAMAGLLVGGTIGLGFGFANGLSRWSDLLTDTTLQMVRNVPHLALIPLVIIWFGIDEGAKLFLVALGVFFPVYLNTLHGITFLTLIVAETIAAQSGIGYMAMQAREFYQTDIVVLAILIYALLGKLADSIVRWLERTMLSWNPAYRTGARA